MGTGKAVGMGAVNFKPDDMEVAEYLDMLERESAIFEAQIKMGIVGVMVGLIFATFICWVIP